jgi:hypothetical protein
MKSKLNNLQPEGIPNQDTIVGQIFDMALEADYEDVLRYMRIGRNYRSCDREVKVAAVYREAVQSLSGSTVIGLESAEKLDLKTKNEYGYYHNRHFFPETNFFQRYDKALWLLEPDKFPEGLTEEGKKILRERNYDYMAQVPNAYCDLGTYMDRHLPEVKKKLAAHYERIATHLEREAVQYQEKQKTAELHRPNGYGISPAEYDEWKREAGEREAATAEAIENGKEWQLEEKAKRDRRATGLPSLPE